MSHQRDFDGGRYQIRVKGHLDSSWQSHFEGMAFTEEIAKRQPTTLISGSIRDQAALHGVLERIRDLNLQLLMVSRIEAT